MWRLRTISRDAVHLKIISAGVFATALLCSHGASRAEDTLGAAFHDRVATIGKRGFLYRVTQPEGVLGDTPAAAAPCRLFLYGTIHVGKPELFPFNALVERTLGGSARLALEADPGRSAQLATLVKEMAIFPESDSLANHIPADLLARLPEMAERYQVPIAQLLRMRAWMLAQSFEVLELSHAGLTGEQGVEGVLARYANERRIPIVEIEGFEKQLQLLSQAPAAVQIDELRESINEIEDGQAVHDAKRLVDAWAAANADDIESGLLELRQQEGPFSQYLVAQILNARNKTMADRAEEFLNEGGVTFFAVGTLHLFSAEGLIAELRRRGYIVTNLQ